LEENIDLPIKGESDAMNENKNNNNDVEGQISEDVQISVKSTKSTKNLQLPKKYQYLNEAVNCEHFKCIWVPNSMYY
jgi:hypothetical protein